MVSRKIENDAASAEARILQMTNSVNQAKCSSLGYRFVNKLTQLNYSLAAATLGVGAVAQETFVAFLGSFLVTAKLGIVVLRVLSRKKNLLEKRYQALPSKERSLLQVRKIVAQTLGVGSSLLVGSLLFWYKGAEWNVTLQKKLGNYWAKGEQPENLPTLVRPVSQKQPPIPSTQSVPKGDPGTNPPGSTKHLPPPPPPPPGGKNPPPPPPPPPGGKNPPPPPLPPGFKNPPPLPPLAGSNIPPIPPPRPPIQSTNPPPALAKNPPAQTLPGGSTNLPPQSPPAGSTNPLSPPTSATIKNRPLPTPTAAATAKTSPPPIPSAASVTPPSTSPVVSPPKPPPVPPPPPTLKPIAAATPSTASPTPSLTLTAVTTPSTATPPQKEESSSRSGSAKGSYLRRAFEAARRKRDANPVDIEKELEKLKEAQTQVVEVVTSGTAQPANANPGGGTGDPNPGKKTIRSFVKGGISGSDKMKKAAVPDFVLDATLGWIVNNVELTLAKITKETDIHFPDSADPDYYDQAVKDFVFYSFGDVPKVGTEIKLKDGILKVHTLKNNDIETLTLNYNEDAQA